MQLQVSCPMSRPRGLIIRKGWGMLPNASHPAWTRTAVTFPICDWAYCPAIVAETSLYGLDITRTISVPSCWSIYGRHDLCHTNMSDLVGGDGSIVRRPHSHTHRRTMRLLAGVRAPGCMPRGVDSFNCPEVVTLFSFVFYTTCCILFYR
ncbi:hypothetical protein F4809DRAFT_410937 [Biscogniauxia mediterranea]|nr:hypothetical protein F4809DRAFT_410937 [Biscogniauxia mediterranea]